MAFSARELFGPPVEGTVYNIQRYSVDDGPGIRTTVFFKGCPLRCQWCCNPESQGFTPEVMSERVIGEVTSVSKVMDTIRRDLPFYRSSGGGVTLSGGEPLAQPAFATAIARQCHQLGLHTALDTCGYADWAALEPLLPQLDLILWDVKHPDDAAHRRGTGVSNQPILDNLRRVRATHPGLAIWLRVPLIPGFNDDEPALRGLSALARELDLPAVHLLPYHEWGTGKYERLQKPYALAGLQPLRTEVLRRIEERLRSLGVQAHLAAT